MIMHQVRWRVLSRAISRASLILPAVALIGAALAQTSYIYVESNIGKTAGKNSVFAFRNDGLGNLTPLVGSPYLTNGTGVFDTSGGTTDPFDADQEVIARQDGSLLFAVNGHSNTIAVFTINADGTLTTVPGSPFASGGQDPASVGLMEDSGQLFLVAANKNEDPAQDIGSDVPNYTTFTVDPSGILTINPGSTLDLAADSSPTQALVRSKGRLLFGMEFGTSRIATYKIRKNGTLAEISSLSPPTEASPFTGEILHPTRTVLYTGLPLTNEVGVYKFTSAGTLTFVRTVPNANGLLVCWLVTNAAGTHLYTAETTSGTVSFFDITVPTNPVLLQTLKLSGHGLPHNLALDPTEAFLYVQAGKDLHVLNIAADGTMSESISPVVLAEPSGEKPIGMAVVRK